MNMEHYAIPTLNDERYIAARVTAVHRDRFDVATAYGFSHAQMKRGLHAQEMPTVGDLIAIEYNPCGDSMAVGILERKTLFARQDSWHGTRQLIAANVDFALITTSLNADFSLPRLERYLVLARESGAQPVFLLTKCDLVSPEDALETADRVRAIAPDCRVLILSAYTGEGMNALCSLLSPGKIAVLLGSSGVGKSSLVNVLTGETAMAVGEIRSGDDKGRHTTVHRQMIELSSGALLIDTPGMRELAMWDAEAGVVDVFAEIAAAAGNCRYRNCTHTHEPGCAVREGAQNGTLDPARVKNYIKLQGEASRSAMLARKRERMKEISKASRRIKKEKNTRD